MNQLIFSLLFVILSLLHGSQSSRSRDQNFSDVEQIFVQRFSEKLLKELGFSSVPNVSQVRVPKIPSFYKHLIEAENNKPDESTDMDEDNFHARTKQLFLFSKQVVLSTNGSGKNYIFKSKSRHSNLKIKSATLWIHVTVTESKLVEKKAGHGNCELQLYKKYLWAGADNGYGTRQLFHSERLTAAGWHKVLVTSTVKEWFSQHPDADLTLEFAMKGAQSLKMSDASDEARRPIQPFLAVETDGERQINRRKRRAVHKCSSSHPQRCCPRVLTVNFRDLNFDFIIDPREMNISYCAGSCDSLQSFTSPKRRQALKLSQLVHQTCCIPTIVKHINVPMLIIEEDKSLSLRKIPNHEIESCYCTG